MCSLAHSGEPTESRSESKLFCFLPWFSEVLQWFLHEFPIARILQWELLIQKPVWDSHCKYNPSFLVSASYIHALLISWLFCIIAYFGHIQNIVRIIHIKLFGIEMMRIWVLLLSYQWIYLSGSLFCNCIIFWLSLSLVLRQCSSEIWELSYELRQLLSWNPLHDELFIQFLHMPKREIFDRLDFPDSYTIKSLRVGDFGVKIERILKNI